MQMRHRNQPAGIGAALHQRMEQPVGCFGVATKYGIHQGIWISACVIATDGLDIGHGDVCGAEAIERQFLGFTAHQAALGPGEFNEAMGRLVADLDQLTGSARDAAISDLEQLLVRLKKPL